MAYISQIPECCGIVELGNIIEDYGRPQDVILQYHEYDRGSNGGAYVIFSDIGDMKRGKQLAAFIRKHKLGVVKRMPVNINPVHNSDLVMWVWMPIPKAVTKWAGAFRKSRDYGAYAAQGARRWF